MWGPIQTPPLPPHPQQQLSFLSQAHLKPPPGTKKQREIFVGNLSGNSIESRTSQMTERMIRDLFSNIISSLPGYNQAWGPPVIHAQLGGGGTHCFVEFRDEAMAATALKFTGLEMCGRPMKICRPQGYLEPFNGPHPGLDVPPDMLAKLGVPGLAQTAAASTSLAAMTSPMLEQKQRELYVGNLKPDKVTARMLKQLFSEPMSAIPGMDVTTPLVIHTEMDTTGKFGFVTLRDEALCDVAIKLFNGMDVLGRPLCVQRPVGYVPTPGLKPLDFSRAAEATTILRLANLLSAEAICDDEEYADICEDIHAECSKHGEVLELCVRRADTAQTPEDIGQAFVKFANTKSSLSAFNSLNGRDFDGSKVQASFLPEDEFHQH